MGIRLIKIAVCYLMLGVLLGLGMGITQQFTLVPVHAHLLLLGWASLALAGIVYQLFPAAAGTRLATLHFWMHNLGLPLFMVGLAFVVTGHAWALPITVVGAVTALLGVLLFAVNVLGNLKPGAVPMATAAERRAA